MDERKLSRFELQLTPGEVVFREGEKSNQMYYIREGRIKISVGKNGYEKVLTVLKEGDFFGETALIEDTPRLGTAIALEETELIIIDKESFEANLTANPAIAHILKNVIQRLRDVLTMYTSKEKENQSNLTLIHH
jgi:CRP/FNR family cyclic AMP-dependent transcriptional regulator